MTSVCPKKVIWHKQKGCNWPLWCLLLLMSPYLKCVRPELNWEKCLWTLSPASFLSRKLVIIFLINKQEIISTMLVLFWHFLFLHWLKLVRVWYQFHMSFHQTFWVSLIKSLVLIPKFDIVTMVRVGNWIIISRPTDGAVVGDNSCSVHWNIWLRKVGN